MKNEYIPIDKELCPYEFSIQIGVELFRIEVLYNDVGDFFSVSLYREEEALVLGEKLVYGVPLFADMYTQAFPAPTIVPLDESGEENTVTYDNLGDSVFLVVDNQ
ncbi:hypothetical protein AAV35_012660 [Salimicrobium jeotgali]|uniref:Cyanophage baseplate Pam3 plug gp18 domain-containing protein n=1 Tax=Salimicrobium jeotgali TaxID=1230341 RepID=K2GJ50_9BACI|nr:hypothetical protein [Salimicrobium jeotgali]AKG05520.1 hypothetical protein AAV35_012660 [Salimicrobium jeotgali]EKE30494.1 hypothetical protein MJ3_13674 [Salimicrobium jeotgali]MBM7696643.1 hypothetical protein [Salimicrobium jeotgali]